MLRLRYINSRTGVSVYLGGEAPYFFLSQTGIDGAEAEAVMVKAPFQKGQTRLATNVDERIITINGCLVSPAEDEKACLKELELRRRELTSVMNPFDAGSLEIYGENVRRMFSGIQVVDGPTFADEDYTAPDGILMFSFSAVVPGNFLEDLDKTVLHLMEVVPLFQFDLEFDESIEFGNMTMGGAEFVNDGDVEAPIIIEIPGPVEIPQITNITTGEFIKVHSPISANETMVINTSFGNKSVVLVDENGAERNAFHYIDLDSAFFQLRPGENYLRFKAEVGNDTANVRITFKKLYWGM